MTIDDLNGLLVDFMDLPETLDLPKLASIRLILTREEPASPKVGAQLSALYGGGVWSAVTAWARAMGAPVTVGEPFSAGDGRYRTVEVRVSYMGVPVTVWTHVRADEEIPQEFQALSAVAP